MMLWPLAQLVHLLIDFLFRAVEKQFGEELAWPAIAGNLHAAARPRKTARHRIQREARVARLAADSLRRKLIERNRIPKTGLGRMRRSRQKGPFRVMAAIHVGMREAGEDGEIFAQRLKRLEIERRRVAAPRFRGKEVLGVNAERRHDRHHAAPAPCRWRGAGREPSSLRASAGPARRRWREENRGGKGWISYGSLEKVDGSLRAMRFIRRLFGKECRAFDDGVNQRPQAVIRGAPCLTMASTVGRSANVIPAPVAYVRSFSATHRAICGLS